MRGMSDFDMYIECEKQNKIVNYEGLETKYRKAIDRIATLHNGLLTLAEMGEDTEIKLFCLQLLDNTNSN